eukprot:CAMPEP_0119005506 /NCGR_PEP_ID=MMETSP1176-20130426/1762_1 /TAXON_ID=265551 /ORGANISM="Synedropsis recta cf, Strain CCMP1620" /LENGTH=346 /DNA_ID=CAMNT_0006957325 /DNA_START=202 /DNA_END=1242 /DNA_ORIENTATION=-
MKYGTAFLSLLLVVSSSNAFQQHSIFSRPALLKASCLHATLTTAPAAKNALLITAERIKADQGVLVYDQTSKSDLEQAVAELEAVGSTPTQTDFDTLFQGDWTLLCTTATNNNGIDTSQFSFLTEGPLQQIRQSLNRSLKVVQSIKSTTGGTTVDRVDHVIEYMPPTTLSDVLSNLPDALQSLNLNPLELTKSKVSLVHKADVTSELSTKLTLESIVLNVAGKSQFLDPLGADVLGINIPLVGDFLNAGSFETTYMDESIRISRSKLGGVVDQLRVFVRSNPMAESMKAVEWVEEDVAATDEYPSDVELEQVEWVDDDDGDEPATDDGDDEPAADIEDDFPSDCEN